MASSGSFSNVNVTVASLSARTIKGTVSAGDPGVAMAEGMIGCLNGEYKDHELVVIAGTEVTPANIGDFYKA